MAIPTAFEILSYSNRMSRPQSILCTSLLIEAIASMSTRNVGCLMAVDEEQNVVGIISEPLVFSAITKEAKWTSLTVSDVMTPASEMVCVSPNDGSFDCLQLMIDGGIRHLPVHDNEQNFILGILSMRTIVDTLLSLRQHMLDQSPFESISILNDSTSSSNIHSLHNHNNGNNNHNNHVPTGAKASKVSKLLPKSGLPKNTRCLSLAYAATLIHDHNHTSNSITSTTSSVPGTAGSSLPLYASLYFQPVLGLSAKVVSIPHPDKVKTGGEDAFVCLPSVGSEANNSNSSLSVLAVFDGVGSWSFEKGIDASLFSRGLRDAVLDYLKQERERHNQNLSNSDPCKPTTITPQLLLQQAWSRMCTSRTVGGSTACLITFDKGELLASTLGDSGFLLLRDKNSSTPRFGKLLTARTQELNHNNSSRLEYRIKFRSPQQLHYFNCPYQLGITASGDLNKFDKPEAASTFSVVVQPNDLILLATDGLFDNLTEDTIVGLIDEGVNAKLPLEVIAKNIATKAQQASLDKFTDSPFAILAKDNNIMWGGGRKDDITIILARVEVTNALTPNPLNQPSARQKA